MKMLALLVQAIKHGLGMTYLSLEQAAIVEELLHSHVGDDGSSFSLDDAFHDILDMVAASGDGS